MPARDQLYSRTIHPPPLVLPPPAVKLTVTQLRKAVVVRGSLQFVWLIVGTFYNRRGEAIWSRQIIWSKVDRSGTDSSTALSSGGHGTSLRLASACFS